MKTTKHKNTIIALASSLLLIPCQAADTTTPATEPDGARVQIALLLDTSNSMDGLIHQARTQMWEVVNTFIGARQDGKVPYVEVAVYEYGNNGLETESHWIRRVLPLTRDLDEVSKQLFALTTNGGEEYCGAVIRAATRDLDWDSSADTYKAIFIAGNEPFTQGPVIAIEACRAAIAKGVIVNTIHCGPDSVGRSTGWADGAAAADGRYLHIDSNRAVAHIAAPQDGEILRLNQELNKTYLAYGRKAADARQNQAAQDSNAIAVAPEVAAKRAATKASANYYNGDWDLVDASANDDFQLAEVPEAELPEEMRKMNQAEREAHVAAKAKERAEVRARILELNSARNSFVAEKRREQAAGGDDTLDAAMIKTVREQAARNGFEFESE